MVTAPVKLGDLESALEFVSDHQAPDRAAYICRDTGKIYWQFDSVDDVPEDEPALPDDLETSDRYIAVPDKKELRLERDLVFVFASRELPNDYREVCDFFTRKGAYRRFRELVVARGKLQVWYDFRDAEQDHALRAWASDNDILLDEKP